MRTFYRHWLDEKELTVECTSTSSWHSPKLVLNHHPLLCPLHNCTSSHALPYMQASSNVTHCSGRRTQLDRSEGPDVRIQPIAYKGVWLDQLGIFCNLRLSTLSHPPCISHWSWACVCKMDPWWTSHGEAFFLQWEKRECIFSPNLLPGSINSFLSSLKSSFSKNRRSKALHMTLL